MVITFGTIRLGQNYFVGRWGTIVVPSQAQDKNTLSTLLGLENALIEINGKIGVQAGVMIIHLEMCQDVPAVAGTKGTE